MDIRDAVGLQDRQYFARCDLQPALRRAVANDIVDVTGCDVPP